MIYNRNTRELRTNDGELLKKLDCPLHKKWDDLVMIVGDGRTRHCGSCRKSVVNLADKSDDEVVALLRVSPKSCVYLASNAANVRVEGFRTRELPDPCPFRRIHTARGLLAINEGVKNGFWPLVKKVEPSPKLTTWVAIAQNETTGEIQVLGDHRARVRLVPPWREVIKPYTFYPYAIEHRVAAYLLPDGLMNGERVFLMDLIEDLVGTFGNQNHTMRLDSAYAVWNGTDFKIEWKEERDADRWIG